jgi:hypothetical protein
LRRQVNALLGKHQNAGSFLEPPIFRGSAVTIDQPLVSERPGSIIGPCKLLQQIGEGGMGTVWMADQTQPCSAGSPSR